MGIFDFPTHPGSLIAYLFPLLGHVSFRRPISVPKTGMFRHFNYDCFVTVFLIGQDQVLVLGQGETKKWGKFKHVCLDFGVKVCVFQRRRGDERERPKG